MMKRFYALAAALAVTANAFAFGFGDNLSVTAELLYLKPSVEDTYFAVNYWTGNESGDFYYQRYNNNFNFTPGFRVGVNLDLCGCDCPGKLAFDYTYLNATHHRDVVGGGLSASVGLSNFAGYDNLSNYNGLASSNNKLRFQTYDLTYQVPLCCQSCLSVGVKAGLEYISYRYTQNANYFASAGEFEFLNTYRHSSSLEGIGPTLGFVFDYPLLKGSCECPANLGLRLETNGILLVGKPKNSFTYGYGVNGESNYDVALYNDHDWKVIPAFNARIGVNYAFAFECLQAELEVGYEFVDYLRANVRTIYATPNLFDQGALSSNQYTDLTLHGLYVTLTAQF